MMSNAIIPAGVKLAAKRGFIRTATQSLSAAIPVAAVTITLSGDWALGVGLGAAGAVATAIMAGTASALSIISKGIPEEYVTAGIDQQFAANSD
jgi:hypothetical protein